MPFPTDSHALRTYYDPSLWDRLVERIREEDAAKKKRLIDGKWKTLEEAREIIGFLQAIDWLFATANDLTRIEDAPQDDPED
jgi:hypothetical protein